MQSEILLLDRAGDNRTDGPFHATALGHDDPFGAGREVAWSGHDALAAGRVRFEGTCESPSFPHIEMLVVVAGRLRLSDDADAQLDLAPGAGAVIARGTVLRAHAEPGTQWVFCTMTGAASAAAGLQELSADAAFAPSAAPPAEVLIGPAPQCRSFNAFTDEAARFRAGTWDSTPYQRISRPHKVNELMHVIAGSVSLTGADGRVTHVAAGDSVFVPQGVACAWDSKDHVAKFYVVQESGA